MRILYQRLHRINQPEILGRCLFLLIFGSFLFNLEFNVISISNYSGISFLEILISFAIMFIGMLLIYRSLAMTFDQTEITINPRGLTVHHVPLPYPGSPDLTIPLSHIRYINWHLAYDQIFNPVFLCKMGGQPINIALVDQENMSHCILADIQDEQYADILVKEINGFLHL